MDTEAIAQKYRKEYSAERSVDFKTLPRLLKYLRPYTLSVCFSILFLFIARSIDAFIPVYFGYLVQKILTAPTVELEIQQTIFQTILNNGAVIGMLLLTSFLLEMVSMYIKNKVGQKAIYTLRGEVYDHIQRLPVSYFDKHALGRLITRTIHDVDQINLMFTESVIPLFGSILLFIGMIVGMIWIDWHIALAFLIILPIVGWLTRRFQYYQRYSYEIIRNIVSAMNTFVQEYLTGALTVRTFGLQKRERRRFEEINRDHYDANILAVHHFSYFIAGIDLLQSLCMISAFVVLSLYSSTFTLSAGAFFTFSLYIIMFFRPLIDLADRYNILQSAMSAAARIFTMMDKKIESVNNNKEVLSDIESIEFNNVWFAYDKEHWILKNFNLKIEKGNSIAFVGLTGVGKSTIFNLLLRFYEVQKGDILINGRSIYEYSLQSVRKQFSIVLQDPVIFSGTIVENIALYEPEINRDQVSQVIDFLDLRKFIEQFPKGSDQHLHEHGESLSMGERQLISLARALAHRRSVLLFDEATANIDSVTEKTIQKALKKMLVTQTSLVIAHRLSTIQDVERIVVLHEGKVGEEGTHAQLLAKKGLYEKLYRLQFAS